MALLFERRPKPTQELSYFLYPIAGKIPGVQEFSGFGGTVTGILGQETDITFVKLGGPADHFDEGNFDITLLTLLDIPIFNEHLTFNAYAVDIKNGAWPEGDRGIDSNLDSSYFLLAETVSSSGADLSLNFFDYQFEVYYGFLDASVKPYGLVDPDGKRYSAEEAKLQKNPRGYRWGYYIDDTDNRRDPKVGYRIQYEKWGMPSTREGNSAFYQEDLNITAFIPVLKDNKGILVLNHFTSSSTITKEGTVDKNDYLCPPEADAACQTALDKLYERQVLDAKNGKATSLGGTNRLRGYRTNRFFDTHSAFRGAEFRWYLLESQSSFNYFIEKGTFTALQLAFFAESGTVAPTKEKLWDSTRTSYGFGIRPIFNTVVVRLDIGMSEEETTTTLFIGYPF